MKRLQENKAQQKVHIKYIDAKWILEKEQHKLDIQTKFYL